MTVEEWYNRSYDYFDLLDEDEQETSFLLKVNEATQLSAANPVS